MTTGATYPPLDVPKPVADGLWIVDSAPIRPLGIPLPLRMAVIRLTGGDLLLHSPTRFTPDLGRALDALGRVAHLLAPDIGHWMFLKAWQQAYPDARTWAVPGLESRRQVRRAGVRIDETLGDVAPPAWSGEIEQALVRGALGFAELDLFHAPTRTLILTDLILNLEEEKLPRLARPTLRLARMTAPHGEAPPYLRLVVRLKGDAPALALSRLLSRHPDRVIFAHGRWFDRDGEAQARRSLRWLLP